MNCYSRLNSLEHKKKQSVQEQIDTFIQLFQLMYDRDPTQEEIENERQAIMKRKSANIKQTAAEIEELVYGN